MTHPQPSYCQLALTRCQCAVAETTRELQNSPTYFLPLANVFGASDAVLNTGNIGNK